MARTDLSAQPGSMLLHVQHRVGRYSEPAITRPATRPITINHSNKKGSSDHPSLLILRHPNRVIEILINNHPEFRMFQIPRLQYVNGSLSRPRRETRPIHALMRTGKISQRDFLHLAPPHGHGRNVCMTHDTLAEYVEAVLVVVAIEGCILLGGVGEVVGGVHVMMKAFLMVWFSRSVCCFEGIRSVLEVSLTRQWSSWKTVRLAK